jgi:hypothetical protein
MGKGTPGDRGHERDKGPAGEEEMRVGGISFWQAVRGAIGIELNTRDDLAVDGRRARWVVTPVTGRRSGPAIESTAPEVRGFLPRVVAEKERMVRRHLERPRPVPKPTRAKMPVPVPPHASVPCPLCRPCADADHPGEAWPDCALGNGEDVITARQAAAWHEEHG